MATVLTRSDRWRAIAIAATASMFVAGVGAFLTDLGPWYQDLREPGWKPPDVLFGPAWTVIFVLAAASASIGYQHVAGQRSRNLLLGLFTLNGLLNLTWSALFFRLKRPDLALYEVFPFWLSIAALIVFLFKKSRLASLLLVPYLLWVLFAGMLNASVVQLNPRI